MRNLVRLAALAAAITLCACGLAAQAGAAEAAGCTTRSAPVAAAGRPINRGGVWSANDGGTYWIRQIGSCLWWAGFSGPVDTPTTGRGFSNVLFGTVNGDGTLSGYWVDVPRGATTGNG